MENICSTYRNELPASRNKIVFGPSCRFDSYDAKLVKLCLDLSSKEDIREFRALGGHRAIRRDEVLDH